MQQIHDPYDYNSLDDRRCTLPPLATIAPSLFPTAHSPSASFLPNPTLPAPILASGKGSGRGRKRKTPPTEQPPPPAPYLFNSPNADYPPASPESQQSASAAAAAAAAGGRQLSTSKRAEQNRKAQRAFRERRDQHVKQLESRASLVDAALASAEEANRRWEECRKLVDQLRAENAALRAAITAFNSAQQVHIAPSMSLGGSSSSDAAARAHSHDPDGDSTHAPDRASPSRSNGSHEEDLS